MNLALRRVCGESFRGVLVSRIDRSASSRRNIDSYERFYTKMASKKQSGSRLSHSGTARFEDLQTKSKNIFAKIQRFATITKWSHLVSPGPNIAVAIDREVNFSLCAYIAVQVQKEKRVHALNVTVPQVVTPMSCGFKRYVSVFQLKTLVTRLHQVRGPPVHQTTGVVPGQNHKNISSTLSLSVCSVVSPVTAKSTEECFYFLRATI